MEDYYVNKINRLENECNSWLYKADEEYRKNSFKHSREEALYLQKAIDCRSQMARLSTGSERSFQQARQTELQQRMVTAVMEFDPDYFKRKQAASGKPENNAVPGKNGSAPKAGGNGASGEKQDNEKATDEELASWKKPIPEQTFENIYGMTELVTKLKYCIADHKRDEIKAFLKIKSFSSYLFSGPPGCGKTFITGAFVHELAGDNYTFFSLDSAEILNKYVGEAEKTLKRLFEACIDNAPCVVFIDEIDGVCKSRTMKDIPAYASSLTTAFLTGYNRILESKKPIIFIGATNHPEFVDSAMRDRVEQVEFGYPDNPAREKKFGESLTTAENTPIPLLGGFSFKDMADLTEGLDYNYRDIDRLCGNLKQALVTDSIEKFGNENAALAAIKAGGAGITREMFLKEQSSIVAENGDAKEQVQEKSAFELATERLAVMLTTAIHEQSLIIAGKNGDKTDGKE